MSQSSFPRIVTDNLTFCYDMSNTTRSWKGRPLTNNFAIPTPNASNDVTFSVNGTGTFKRVPAGAIYGNYKVKDTDVVYRYDLGTAGCHYHGNDVAITAGTVATWSCDYYIDPTATSYPTTNYLANFEGVVSGYVGDPTPSIRGVWKRFVFSSTAGSSGTCRMLLYPGNCGGSYLAAGGYILYRNPQVEFSAPGGQPSPFIAGTRLSTESILDVVANQTITANSLTYNSDNTFSFNGSSDYLTVGNLPGQYDSFTVNVWFYPTTVGNYKNVLDCNFAYNGSTGNIGPRLEMNSSGQLIWILSGDTVTNSNYNGYVLVGSGLQANRWHNAVITRNGAHTISVYLNGEAISTNAANSLGFVDVFSNIVVGKGFHLDSAATRSFAGQVPLVMIYNRALSTNEVKQNFNAHRGRYNV